MPSFADTLELMRIELEQCDGTLLLVGVCDDTNLRDYAIKRLRDCVASQISLRDFRYDPEHLSFLEAVADSTQTGNGRVALSVTGLEELPHDKWSEAIKLLNLPRNRFGYTGAAVILWINRAALAEIATKSADFFSWRSGTFIIEPPPGWDTLDSQRESYLQALVKQNEFVNLQGLTPMRGGQIVQMRMDDIFVPLRAEYEVLETKLLRLPAGVMGPEESEVQVIQEADLSVSLRGIRSSPRSQVMALRVSKRVLADEDQQDIPPELRTTLQHFLAEERPRVETRPVEIADMLKDRHAVVLGDPGAGKTTLLRYLVYMLAKARLGHQPSAVLEQQADLTSCLPVYLRIGEYAQPCHFHPETTITAFALTSAQARQLPLSEALLTHELQENRVVFLLDGLDEITAASDRRDMAQRIEEFVRAHPQRRVIITSRLVGYREVPLSQEFAQFTIRPFEPDDIRRFIDQWYAALQEPESAGELCKAIADSPSVRRLAANPLLLTVIALIHRRPAKLPHQRATLYKLAAETLVDQWMTQRRVIPEGWDVQETLQVLLPAVAWHLHATTSSGLIGEHALHDLLVKTLREQDDALREDEAQRRAAQFRRNVSEFSGIFLERGLDQEGRGLYGFLHLTFEEYFAAVQLNDQWDRKGPAAFKPLLHQPRWTEVMLLTAGHLSESGRFRTTEFVKDIRSARSPYEKILHRDLLLAARCLADDIGIDVGLRRELVAKLVEHAFASSSPSALQGDLRQMLVRFAGVAAEKEAVAAVLGMLQDREGNVRRAAVATLGQWGGSIATGETLSAVLGMLRDREEYVRRAAVATLGQWSSFIRLAQWSYTLDDFARLARSQQAEKKEAGYVCLRNVLAGEQESALDA